MIQQKCYLQEEEEETEADVQVTKRARKDHA